MNELALFAGAGGGILGGKLLGWRTICSVEWNSYARRVLHARQDDGTLPPFPIWDDVQTFDGHPWRGRVDVVSGGFPCQDISAAGKGAGIEGARSGMWHHMARIIREVGPRYVFVENYPMLTTRGLGQVLGDLAALGYDARWGVLGAVDAGAPHKRDRIWIVAHAKSAGPGKIESGIESGFAGAWRSGKSPSSLAYDHGLRELQPQGAFSDFGGWAGNGGEDVANASGGRCGGSSAGESEQQGRTKTKRSGKDFPDPDCLHEQRIKPSLPHAQERPEPSQRPTGSQRDGVTWWESEPDVGRVAHGVAARVDRLRCLGNGQVPAVVRLAWHHLAPPAV